jgi:1-Cys peroxiredoxin 6
MDHEHRSSRARPFLQTISEEEADGRYPGYHTCGVPSKIPHLRLVKADKLK